jgi:selenocysteine lyase/cysteine desulfurase
MDAAVNYLAQLGRTLRGKAGAPDAQSLHDDARTALNAIRSYERGLSLDLLAMLKDNKAQIYGIDAEARISERVPTVCFNIPGVLPQDVTEAAARADIGIRDGHMYSPRLMQRLGLSKETGAVRISLVHYNTAAEIQRLAAVLAGLRRR